MNAIDQYFFKLIIVDQFDHYSLYDYPLMSTQSIKIYNFYNLMMEIQFYKNMDHFNVVY